MDNNSKDIDFISLVAHELKAPLTSLKGYLSVFINENKNQFNEEQNMFLARMNTSTQRMGALIENLLNASRIDRGVLSLNIESLDWESTVKEIVGEFMEQAKEKKIELIVNEPVAIIPHVMADKFRIVEVLLNLLSNAISYTPNEGKIEVSIEYDNNNVITHVQDTGEGIPEDVIPKLFTKFYRVNSDLSKKSNGTGLGLYISKTLVEMHKGKIWVESQKGKGSTFSFSLPVA